MQLFYFTAILLGIIFFGTAGYALVEGWSLNEAFYMTIISITAVGFQEVHPLSPAGRMFTAVLLLVGVGVVFYIMAAKRNEEMTFNPGAHYTIQAGDTLYAMGRPEQIASLRECLQNGSKSALNG